LVRASLIYSTCPLDPQRLPPGSSLLLTVLYTAYQAYQRAKHVVLLPNHSISMKGNFASCIAAVTLALLVSAVSSELVLTYSIQRHGARNVLPKSAVLTENGAAGGPTLLPAGQQMCYEAGGLPDCHTDSKLA
jgi:hypothetical protein